MNLNQENKKELLKLVNAELDRLRQEYERNHQGERDLTDEEEKKIIKGETKLVKLAEEYVKCGERQDEIKKIFAKDKYFSLATGGYNYITGEVCVNSQHPIAKAKAEKYNAKIRKMDGLKIEVFTKIHELEQDFSSIMDFIKKAIANL